MTSVIPRIAAQEKNKNAEEEKGAEKQARKKLKEVRGMNDYDGERKGEFSNGEEKRRGKRSAKVRTKEWGKGGIEKRGQNVARERRRRQQGRVSWRRKKRVAGKTNIAYLC